MMCIRLFVHMSLFIFLVFFFFNDTATTEIYTLSLHDALPIFVLAAMSADAAQGDAGDSGAEQRRLDLGKALGPHDRRDELHADRKSTRLNSSHSQISYAVFCLKKKKR